jgi:hypothetical protein
MSIPNVNLHVQDGGLGASIPGAGGTMVVIGCCSAGTDFQPLSSTQPSDFSTNRGYGPAPELAGFIANQTGNDVILVKATSATPGANTAVRTTRVGSSTSVVTLTGTPLDSYYGKVTVKTGGTVGTAGMILEVSLDNGRTVYATINLGTASTYLIPNTGITLNFAAGTLDVGDVFQWVSTEPLWGSAGVVSAIQALYGVATTFQDILIVGGSTATSSAGGPGATAGDIATIDTAMTALFNKKRFHRAMVNLRDADWGGTSSETEAAWMASLTAAIVSTEALRTGATAGHYNCISAFSQSQFRRPLLFQAGARDSAVAIQVDLARVADGSLASTPNSPPLVADGFIYHDEDRNPGLDAARLLTARTFPGRPGWYITNPNTLAAPGSDFSLLQMGHVIDAATAVAYQYFLGKLSDSVRVDATSGKILEVDAQALEGGCNAQLKAVLVDPGAVSSAFTTVNRTTNILSTKTLYVTVSVIPLGYLKTIDVTITFLNPALLAA